MLELLPIERTFSDLARVDARIAAVEQELVRRGVPKTRNEAIPTSQRAPDTVRTDANEPSRPRPAQADNGPDDALLHARRMREIIDVIPFPIDVTDPAGRILLANHALVEGV